MDQERMVYERYKRASEKKEESLCCPTSYNRKYLDIIPEEIIEKDYGCGDPSKYILEGETVLDLGSGGGKLVYIIAQVVGSQGKVIGVDMNKDMISLAKRYENIMTERLGYKNFEFKRGRIQNLKLDLDKLDTFLKKKPVFNVEDYLSLDFAIKEMEDESPLVPDNDIDVVVSNCVLNLVRDDEKLDLFKEIFRVLKKDGRAIISDIVSDKDVPKYLKEDFELWSGCISGAMREDEFISAFKSVGFKDVDIVKREEKPWRSINGINFYSITVSAYKGERKVRYSTCCGANQIILDFKDRLEILNKKLVRERIDLLQINVGGLCNQSCSHCHISAGPDDYRVMQKVTIDKVLHLIEKNCIETVDITGGAPELNPNIEYLLNSLKKLVKNIIFRTNLTALREKESLLSLLADRKISLYASLPSLKKEKLENQRGYGVFEKSVKMLKGLNSIGFGLKYELNIVYNPTDFNLPESSMSEIYQNNLREEYGIVFNNLISIANVPIGNFKKALQKKGLYENYINSLMASFNSKNLDNLMCKNLINIGFDGSIYDCDFNNALGIKIGHIDDMRDLSAFIGNEVKVDNHCYACTASKGSSCFGSLCK